MCWTYFKTIGHSLKHLSSSQTTLRNQIFSKKVVFLVSSGKNKVSSFFPPQKNTSLHFKKLLLPALANIFRPSCTQRLINHGQLVKQWFDQVRLKADVIGSVSSVVDLHWSISLAYTSKPWLSWKLLVQRSELGRAIAPLAKCLTVKLVLVHCGCHTSKKTVNARIKLF